MRDSDSHTSSNSYRDTASDKDTEGDSDRDRWRQYVRSLQAVVTIDLVKLPSCHLSPIAEICVVASEFIK